MAYVHSRFSCAITEKLTKVLRGEVQKIFPFRFYHQLRHMSLSGPPLFTCPIKLANSCQEKELDHKLRPQIAQKTSVTALEAGSTTALHKTFQIGFPTFNSNYLPLQLICIW